MCSAPYVDTSYLPRSSASRMTMFGGRLASAGLSGALKYADFPDSIVRSRLMRHFTRVIEQLTSTSARPVSRTNFTHRLMAGTPTEPVVAARDPAWQETGSQALSAQRGVSEEKSESRLISCARV